MPRPGPGPRDGAGPELLAGEEVEDVLPVPVVPGDEHAPAVVRAGSGRIGATCTAAHVLAPEDLRSFAHRDDADRLGDRDLDMVDPVAVPQGLEEAVAEAVVPVGDELVEGEDGGVAEDARAEVGVAGEAEVDAEDEAFGADRGGELVEALAGAAGQVEDRLAGVGTQSDRSCAPLLTVERLEAAVVERGEPVVPGHGRASVGLGAAGCNGSPGRSRCCT